MMMDFLRSETYKNFWKFLIAGGLTGGLLTALSGFIYAIATGTNRFIESFYLGLFGMGFAFVCAVIGIFVMHFLGKGQTRSAFKLRSLVVGFVLASAVCIFFIEAVNGSPTWWLLNFPGIPAVGSIYFFWFFADRYIYPLIGKLPGAQRNLT